MDTTLTSNNVPQQSVIAPNDILSIYVTTPNPASAMVFNAPNLTSATANGASGSQIQSSGFLVDADGFIQYPIIGNIKVKGMTTMQLKEYISKALNDKKLLVDFVVSVRQLNFKVSVLGEVARPTVINVANEQITLLEALGLAGDITLYGRKDHVMIIRQENDKKTIAHVDLNSNQLFTSPYYYLKSKDVVYVETGKSRIFGTSSTSQILPIVLGVLSLAAIIITNVNNN
jgi:polysaccharide export outer membrane protein